VHIKNITSHPDHSYCSPLFLLMNLVAIEATKEESRPPERSTPHGTSLIILRFTA
jgi:hypothetical protein